VSLAPKIAKLKTQNPTLKTQHPERGTVPDLVRHQDVWLPNIIIACLCALHLLVAQRRPTPSRTVKALTRAAQPTSLLLLLLLLLLGNAVKAITPQHPLCNQRVEYRNNMRTCQ
jgi:nitrate reductase gamma subunit